MHECQVGTFRIGEQRRFMRVCAYTQTHQSNRCAYTKTMDEDDYFNILKYFTSENIHRELVSLINPAMYLLNTIFEG